MDDLKKAVAAYKRATDRADETRTELRRAILTALAEGVTQAELVRITGYTRERLRQIARDAQ